MKSVPAPLILSLLLLCVLQCTVLLYRTSHFAATHNISLRRGPKLEHEHRPTGAPSPVIESEIAARQRRSGGTCSCTKSNTMTTAGPSRSQLQSLPTYQNTTSSRLKFLYSDFSGQRHSNPGSFSSNVEWWRRTLEAFVLNGWQTRSGAESNTPDRLVLHATGPLLTEEFRLEGVGRPLGLATVIVSACLIYAASGSAECEPR